MAENGVEMTLRDVVMQLFDMEAIKFGNFILKSGIKSPIYVDMRATISRPSLMMDIVKKMWRKLMDEEIKPDLVCGVPYGAVPWATCFSVVSNLPMLFHRKEVKDHGTKKFLEGSFTPGQKCVVVEDVLVSGSSIMETVKVLRSVGIEVSDAVVFLNREQGGVPLLGKEGIRVHDVVTMSQMLKILFDEKRLDMQLYENTREFIRRSQLTSLISKKRREVLKYEDRARLSYHRVSKELFHIISTKKTNLALSVDVTTCDEVLRIAEELGKYICILKTHVDILVDFKMDFVKKLKKIAIEKNFLLFEDRKFADIGNTVNLQFSKGLYNIASWADIINAHPLPGPGIVQGLKEVGLLEGNACLLVAEMSTKDHLYSLEYMKATVKMALEHKNFVIGFICQSKLCDDPGFIHMMPGVKTEGGSDTMGQGYIGPIEAIEKGADVIIVGRGILKSDSPIQAAIEYRDIGYQAYMNMLPSFK